AATPANAQLGLDTTLKGYPYSVYSKDGHSQDVATVTITGMQHGTPIEPGTGEDEGGQTGSFTYAVKLYSPYYAAKFFGLVPSRRRLASMWHNVGLLLSHYDPCRHALAFSAPVSLVSPRFSSPPPRALLRSRATLHGSARRSHTRSSRLRPFGLRA